MTKREALICIRNMAKRVQLDHKYKHRTLHMQIFQWCPYTYLRQKKAMHIINQIIEETKK